MLDPNVVFFVMLTEGFGHTSTPMQWGVVGSAMLRRVEEGCSPSYKPHPSALRYRTVGQSCRNVC